MKTKKILSVLLVLVLLIGSMAACNTKDDGKTNTPDPSTSSEENNTDSTDTTKDNEVVELDVFINHSWWPIDTFTGIIPEAITEATGVKLNVTIAADESQLGLMIASNDIPDIVFTDKEINRLSSPNLSYSYNELLSQYAPDYKFNDLQVSIGKSLSKDGNYYTILNAFNTGEEWAEAPIAPGQASVFYRKDIYEAMGSPKMENMDDLLNVFETVKTNYPDMVPLGLGGFWKLQSVSAWLGSSGGNTYQYNDNGSVVHYTSVPEYKEFLKYSNTLSRKEYITAEAYAESNEANSHGVAYNGGCFAYSWYLSPGGALQVLNAESQKINPDAEWAVMEALGGEHANYATSKGWSGMFISKNCKDAEAATRLMTFLFSEEGRRLTKWGREGIEYTMGENGMPVWTEEWMEASKDPDTMNKKYNQYFYFGASGIEDVLPGYAGLDAETLAAFATYKNNYNMYPEIGIAEPSTDSDMGILSSKLQEMLKAEEAKVIFSTSDEEFEANFKALQDKLTSMGVEDLNTYMTDTVNKVKADFGF